MASLSPLGVRRPLAQRTVNTTFSQSTASQKLASLTYKPNTQKRQHSQITTADSLQSQSVQSQILAGALTPVLHPRPQRRLIATDVRPKPIAISHQFKHPLPKMAEKRQRQETHDPGQEGDKELAEWRKSIKLLLSKSTFYFDGVEETFKEQAARWLVRANGVNLHDKY